MEDQGSQQARIVEAPDEMREVGDRIVERLRSQQQ